MSLVSLAREVAARRHSMRELDSNMDLLSISAAFCMCIEARMRRRLARSDSWASIVAMTRGSATKSRS
jgi:predicted membrane chloride channel (bestrophin family)